MSDSSTPRPYSEWREGRGRRGEDAAYVFGHDLMKHCREEALKEVGRARAPESPEELRALVEKAVDTALHNVVDLLEGFWRTEAGPDHTVEYVLGVSVRDASHAEVERIDISPCLLDLPIGYWKWRDGGFR